MEAFTVALAVPASRLAQQISVVDVLKTLIDFRLVMLVTLAAVFVTDTLVIRLVVGGVFGSMVAVPIVDVDSMGRAPLVPMATGRQVADAWS